LLRGKGKKEEKVEEEPMPEASFPSLVLTLAAGALQHMGLVDNPATQKREQDLRLAKHTIDMLEMLKKKTKGNLQKEEENLLEELLYDLRMKFVRVRGKGEDVEAEEEEREQAQEAGSKRREAES
jgi:hypothetical protein